MAHVQKFSAGSAARILGHCDREKNEDGYLKYRTDSDIDGTKTHLNFSMLPEDGLTAQQRLQNRLENVHVLKRKDVNVMCDWVITLPKDYAVDPPQFFRSSFDFLKQRYGEDNIISANVHMDEASPHMHFCFVPVVWDKKKEWNKVSAKEVLSKSDLNSFHGDLAVQLNKELGLPKEAVCSGITKAQGGNKSVSELKELKDDIKSLLRHQRDLSAEIQAARSEFKDLTGISPDELQYQDKNPRNQHLTVVSGIASSVTSRTRSLENGAEVLVTHFRLWCGAAAIECAAFGEDKAAAIKEGSPLTAVANLLPGKNYKPMYMIRTIDHTNELYKTISAGLKEFERTGEIKAQTLSFEKQKSGFDFDAFKNIKSKDDDLSL